MNTPTSRSHHHVSTAPAADAPGSCNWLMRHFHRTPVAGWGLLLLCLVFVRTSTAQQPTFRIGDTVLVQTYNLSYNTAHAQHFETSTTTTTYTYGAGLTNESYSFSSWSLLSLNSLGIYGNRYRHAMWQWSTNEWTWHNDGLYGRWASFREIDKDDYITSLEPLTQNTVWQNNGYSRVFDGPVGAPDYFNGFKGPVGTISTTNEFGATTTDTYTTTAGLYVPGNPASTNEHLYRVQLSLEYDNRTPIPMTAVTSYLGQPPDLNSNVYVWLREGYGYTTKPQFYGAGPTFYSYSAEANRADQHGTLLISTIARGGTWPGTYPTGIAQSMGFPANEADPSDDQMAFDYIMNSPLADNFTLLINDLLAARGIPIFAEKDHSRGQVGSLSDDERKYMVLLLLARSINPDPPVELDYANLELFIGTNFVYRLVNEFSIEAAGYNDKFGHDVAGRNVLRKQAKIGKTTLELESDVTLRLRIYPGTPLEFIYLLDVPKALANPVIRFFSGFLSNDEGAGHNTILGGQKGSPSIKQICAGRAGETLRDLEQPLLRKMPPDFSCWVIYRVAGNSVNREVKFSLDPVGTWPTFFEYHYDFSVQKYLFQPPKHAQMETPFSGFLSLGP